MKHWFSKRTDITFGKGRLIPQVNTRLAQWIFLIAAALIVNPIFSAVTIAEYRFSTANVAGLSATTVSSGYTASAVSSNNTSQFFANNLTAYPTAPVLQINPNNTTATLDQAIANSTYFSLTLSSVTPLSLALLTFDAARGGASAGDRGYAVRSSLTGATNLAAVNLLDTSSYVRPNFLANSIDLSAYSQLQNVAGPVTFYFYVYAPSNGQSLEFDNIIFSVPEPGKGMLFAMGGIFFILQRKRRK